MIHGMVDRPLVFTMEELKRLPSVSRIHFLECTGNSGMMHYKSMMRDLKKSPEEAKSTYVIQTMHGRVSTSEWTGVPLSLLLKEAGVQKGASWMVAEGDDMQRHSKSMPLAKAMDDVMVAYGQNGEALRREQGYPLRLVVPGFQGVNNVKFLRSIKVVDKPYFLQIGKRSLHQFETGWQGDLVRISSRTEVLNHLPIGPASAAGARLL